MTTPQMYELTDREISALHRENTGPAYKRMGVITDRAIQAQIEAALAPVTVCDFKNKYGWCTLPYLHLGTHTVVNLGSD